MKILAKIKTLFHNNFSFCYSDPNHAAKGPSIALTDFLLVWAEGPKHLKNPSALALHKVYMHYAGHALETRGPF